MTTRSNCSAMRFSLPTPNKTMNHRRGRYPARRPTHLLSMDKLARALILMVFALTACGVSASGHGRQSLPTAGPAGPAGPASPPAPDRAEVRAAIDRLPLSFVPNLGQIDAGTPFY